MILEKLIIPLRKYPAEGEAYTAIEATQRQALLDLLDGCKQQQIKRGGNKGCFEISMPCGYSKVFKEHEDIPSEDLPCPCGGSGRYLIRYEKE